MFFDGYRPRGGEQLATVVEFVEERLGAAYTETELLVLAPRQHNGCSAESAQHCFELLLTFARCECLGTLDSFGPERPTFQKTFMVTCGSVDLFVVHQELSHDLFRQLS